MIRFKCTALLIIILSGCQWTPPSADGVIFDEIPPMGFASLQDIMDYTSDIIYVSDQIHDCDDYWQSPDQTYIWNAGDCEDCCILAMYFIHQELGFEPTMIFGCFEEQSWHAWVSVCGEWWEPQGGCRCEYYIDAATEFLIVGYDEAIYRSTHGHRALELP